jgi:3-methylcrotonyl-CoA carboxylase alpha subunit
MPNREKLLIANRGEIACRIIRACRSLGLPSVAIYSEADRESLHVEMADESIEVGPPPVRHSYGNGAAILAAARESRASVIHPGYGFLSEDGGFAQAVADAGLKWVGPRPASIADMGDKERARDIAKATGVPVLPGSARFSAGDLDGLREQASEVGYPLLVKASAGGGGIGMRRVDEPSELVRIVESTQSMVGKAFGDASVYLERYVTSARHLEVQVFGYGDGNGVHLYDRDCSVQRRFQKIIEEAPAPEVPDVVRGQMYQAAMALVHHQRYVGAGTVEFIYDIQRGEVYFLEMNTRIQVEHPVTEMITGVDLIGWQIQQALGQFDHVKQEALVLQGHSIEARLYAERPDRNFLPAPGLIGRLEWPPQEHGLRVDTGVRGGDRVTPHYDPLIAKIIAHGGDRYAAIGRLAQGLEELSIEGVETNQNFLSSVVRNPQFVAGGISTNFVEMLLGREVGNVR